MPTPKRKAAALMAPKQETRAKIRERPEDLRKRHNALSKRRKTLFGKLEEMRRIGCGDTDIYVLIRQGVRYFGYLSKDDSSWPPTREQLDQCYPVPKLFTPKDLQKKDETLRSSTKYEKDFTQYAVGMENTLSREQASQKDNNESRET